MKLLIDRQAPLCLLIASFTLIPAVSALAQHDTGGARRPKQYLSLTNVELKPEQSSPFAKIEGERIEALRADKALSYHLGMWSLTNDSHIVYINGFASFADLQKAHDEAMDSSKLADRLKEDDAEEAPLVAERHSSIFSYENDMSLSLATPPDLSKMRFMRMIVFHIRSGHDQEWVHVMKLLVKAYQSSIPEARWDMYLKLYGGGNDNTYMLVTSMESLSFVDDLRDDNKKLRESVGEDQFQILKNGLDAAVESSESDLFAFGPKISYIPDEWISSSPDFWGKK